MSGAITGFTLLLIAGFLIQLPVYSRRLSISIQTAARFPIMALLLGFAVNLAVRMLELMFPALGSAGAWLHGNFGGFTNGSDLPRISTMYLALPFSLLAGIAWAAAEFFRTHYICSRISTIQGRLIELWKILNLDTSGLREIVTRNRLEIASSRVGVMHSMLVLALREGRLILFTLKSGKVYIGGILATGSPENINKLDSAVTVLPIKSGRRCEATRRVIIETDYDAPIAALHKAKEDAETYDDIQELDDILNTIGQTFRISEIETATLYSRDLHDLFVELGEGHSLDKTCKED